MRLRKLLCLISQHRYMFLQPISISNSTDVCTGRISGVYNLIHALFFPLQSLSVAVICVVYIEVETGLADSKRMLIAFIIPCTKV